jgi:hypothetical protein
MKMNEIRPLSPPRESKRQVCAKQSGFFSPGDAPQPLAASPYRSRAENSRAVCLQLFRSAPPSRGLRTTRFRLYRLRARNVIRRVVIHDKPVLLAIVQDDLFLPPPQYPDIHTNFRKPVMRESLPVQLVQLGQHSLIRVRRLAKRHFFLGLHPKNLFGHLSYANDNHSHYRYQYFLLFFYKKRTLLRFRCVLTPRDQTQKRRASRRMAALI